MHLSLSLLICKKLYSALLFLAGMFFCKYCFPQAPGCPSISAGNDQNLNCSTNCTNLTASVFQSGKTTSYTVSSIPYSPPSAFNVGTQLFIGIDDVWSDIINLPFNFCFYQNMYNQIIVGTNGVISFDVSDANGLCEWNFNATCPTPGPPPTGLYNNSIMGAFHDMDPSQGGTIKYLLTGTAPCRMFIISYFQVPQYNCFFSQTTQQIVFYETTNAIEVYIQNKPNCSDGANPNAVIGIQNSTGTSGISPSGRNTGIWTASNEAWRFTPSGLPNYTVRWYDSFDNFIDTGLTITVCPNDTSSYISKATYSHCDGTQVLVTDTVIINTSGDFTVTTSIVAESCTGNDGTATVIPSSEASPYSFQWNTTPPQTTATATGLTGGTYIVTITGTGGCSIIDTVVIPNVSPPFANAGNDTTICTGNSVLIGGSPTGPAGSTFDWTPSGTLNNNIIANPLATPSAVTDYIVTVTDTNNCVASDTVTVSLFSLLVAVVSNDTAICNGDTIPLFASGGISYNWSPSASLDNPNVQNPQVFPVTTTTYTVTVTDANGCTDTEPVIITVNNLPDIDAGNDTAICIGDTVQIGGSPTSSTGIIFSWSPNLFINDTTLENPDVFPNATTTYFVSVTAPNSCKSSDSIVVSLNSLPDVSAGNDTSICNGNSVQLNATCNCFSPTFLWLPSASLNDATLQNPIATPTANTDYIVTVTDENSCSNSDTVNVSLFSGVTAIASNDTTICIGDTILLFASGGISYNWSPSASLDNPNVQNPQVFPVTTTTYTVTVTDANGCTDTEPVIITVNNLPDIDAGKDTAICIGDTIQIGGSPTSSTGIIFSWSPNIFMNDTTLANPDVFPNSTTTYFVSVTAPNSCKSNDSIVVSVNNLPVVDAGNDTTICDGQSVQLNANCNCLSPTYLWSPATALSDVTIANPTATPSSNISYTVVVTDTNGCVNSDDVNFIVNANPLADAGTGGTLCVGDSLQLNGSGGGNYLWFPSDSLTNPNISNPFAFPANTITYFLIVSDVNNCSDTDSVTVNINQLPPADAGPDLWVCPNDSVQITASGGIIYSWLPTNGLSDATILNPKASPADTTIYYVTVTDANGCVNIDSMKLDVGIIVPTDAGPNQAICIFDTVQIGGSPTAPQGSILSWNTSQGLSDTTVANPLAYPQDTITYYVSTTNFVCNGYDSVTVIVNFLPIVDAGTNDTICIGDSAQLNATGATTFVWTPNINLSDDSILNPLAFPNDTTLYFVAGTDNKGCSNTDSVKIIVNLLPAIITNNDTEICIGDSTQLSASGGTIYVWTPANTLTDDSIANPIAFPSDTTTYNVEVTDGNNCVNNDSVIVIVNPLPVISITGNFTICIGDSTQLIANGGENYSWTPTNSLSNPGIENPFAFPTDTTEYFVTVTDSNNCVNNDSVTVIVNFLPDVIVTADSAGIFLSDSVQICFNDTIQLIATGATNYIWNPTSELDNPNISNPFAFPANTTTYIVTGTDDNSCSNSDSIKIIVNPLPNVNATADSVGIPISDSTQICFNDTVQLNATGGTNFVWNPTINLDNPNISNPLAFPANTTTYVVTGTDDNLCSNSDSIKIIVNSLPIISITGNFTICIGDSTQLIANGGENYSWTPTSSLSNPNIENPFAFPTDTTEYFVTVVDSNNCVNNDSVTVIVNFLPDVIVTADSAGIFLSDSVQICFNDTIQLNAMGATNYVWNPATNLSNPNIANPLAFPANTTTYVVIGTDNNSCSNSDSIKIMVNPLPTISIAGDFTICIGDSTQLTASGGENYSWTPTTTLSNPNIENPFAFPNDTTEYFVSVTDSNNCANSDSATVIVNFLPNVFVTADSAGIFLSDSVQICFNDTIQLIATGATNYIWNTSETTPSIFSTLTSTSIFFVTGTDDNSCSNFDSIKIMVNPLPTITTSADTTICFGDTIQLSTTGATNYVWNPATELDNPNIENPLAFPANTTTYIVTGTDDNSCSNSESIKIIVNPLPNVNVTADSAGIFLSDSVNICVGDTIQLNATGGTNFVWNPTINLDNPNIANPFAFPANTKTYFVTGTDDNSCSNFDSIKIIVNPLPVISITGNFTICIGDSTQLTASGGENYSWTPTTTLSNPNIENPFAFPNDTTEYFVAVTDSNNCANSDSATVIVNFLPNVIATADSAGIFLSDSVQICFNDTIQLNATGATNYVWNPATELDNPNIANPFAFTADTKTYFVTGTDDNLCSNSDSIKIIVNPLPTIITNNDTAICIGDSAQLSASGGTIYVWTPANTLTDANIQNPQAFPSDTTTYTITVTDGNNCANTDSITIAILSNPVIDAGLDTAICIGDAVQLNASGGNNYLWNPASTLDNPNISNPLAFPVITTMYFVSATDLNNCVGTDSVKITVNPLSNAPIANDTSSCFGYVVPDLNAVGSNLQWYDTNGNLIFNGTPFVTGQTSVGMYSYLVTQSENNCESPATMVNLSIYENPNVDAGSDTSICSDASIQLNASGGISYQWFPISGLNNPNIANPVATLLSDSMKFFVTVTDENGCIGNDSIIIKTFSISISPDTIICVGDNAMLTVTAISGYAPYSYLWNTNETINSITAVATAATTFSITVSESSGCSDSADVTVSVKEKPNADFSFKLEASCIGAMAQFENKSENATSYLWLFGDGKTSSKENPEHLFLYNQMMDVTLVASNNSGCDDSSSLTQSIKSFDDYFDIVVPNVFTPNGDGQNDFFEIRVSNKLQTCTDLKIFNRWGETIFSSSGNQHRWSGENFAGSQAPTGTYFFIFDINGKEFKGAVTLIR